MSTFRSVVLAGNLKTISKAKSKNVPDEVKVLFRGFKPYRRGKRLPFGHSINFVIPTNIEPLLDLEFILKMRNLSDLRRKAGPNAIFRVLVSRLESPKK